jgi:hypothetical protein
LIEIALKGVPYLGHSNMRIALSRRESRFFEPGDFELFFYGLEIVVGRHEFGFA